MIVTLLVGYFTNCILAEWPHHCSEYLVSGLHGVEDSALTASGSHKDDIPGADFYPKNARLYGDKSAGWESSAAWCSNALDTNQFLQIEFPQLTVITAVMIQGRGDGFDHFVKTFHLLHSSNGATWITVTGPDGNAKVFPGSPHDDMDAVVRTSVTPSITAKFIRVNPRNWNFHICLRFDVSGCYVPFKGYRRSKRFRMASISNTGALAPYRILQAGMSTFVDCARACTENDRCVSFICLGITCNGYNQYINRSFVSQETPYYYSTINTDRLMYESDHDRKGIYKVNEMRQNRSSAAQGCEQQFTSLIKMSAPQMSFLQAVISSNKVMIQDYRFYVSGHYETDWRYDDGTEISDLSLWSPSQPDPSDGACVMMTQSGLSSVDCSELLFFICHH